MATTLERSSFFDGIRGHANIKLDNPTGFAAGQAITVTHPTNGKSVQGTINQLLPFGSARMTITQQNIPSGTLYLPKGSTVA